MIITRVIKYSMAGARTPRIHQDGIDGTLEKRLVSFNNPAYHCNQNDSTTFLRLSMHHAIMPDMSTS